MSEWQFEPPIDIADRDVGLAAVLKKLRYDLTACQAKLSEAMRMVATLDLDEGAGDRVPCPKCLVKLPGPRTLAEHDYQTHGGPMPAHYHAIEALADDPPLDLARAGSPDPEEA